MTGRADRQRWPLSSEEPAVSHAVPSPCVDVCRMDPRTGWCIGCQRSIDEIAAWSTLDDAAKRLVWKELPLRRAHTDRLKPEAA